MPLVDQATSEETMSGSVGGFSAANLGAVTAIKLSPGLQKAMTKGNMRKVCACGFPIPKYPGRYISKCPNCQTPLESAVSLAQAVLGQGEPDDGEPDPDDDTRNNDRGGGMEDQPDDIDVEDEE